jgi:predicted transcriptional regulator
VYKKIKIKIKIKIKKWGNEIVNSDISNYIWVWKFENSIVETKKYFRKEVIEKIPIQLNNYAYHQMMHHKPLFTWIINLEVTFTSYFTSKILFFYKEGKQYEWVFCICNTD